MHDSSRDFPVFEADVHKRPPVAHPSMLRSHWRGVRSLYDIIYLARKHICLYQITRSVRESVSNQRLWMTVLRDAAQICM